MIRRRRLRVEMPYVVREDLAELRRKLAAAVRRVRREAKAGAAKEKTA